MDGIAGQTESLWMRTGQLRRLAPLQEDMRADVCVFGAGIAGVTTAYLLARAGKQVVLLDDGPVGGGETGRTTAHLSTALDDRYHVLERLHGPDGARAAAQSHGAAIDWIETTTRELAIDCDFTRLDGFLFAPPGKPADILEAELEAARRAGVPGVELLTRATLPSFDTGPCLRFPQQGQFHPLAFLDGLVSAFEALGGRTLGAHVTTVEAGPPARIATEAGPVVTADFVVCATNTPVIDWLVIHTKQAAYRTFVIGARVSTDLVPRALYWDTEDPYHYVRLHGDLLIVGGEDHKTGQEDDGADRFARLESWARQRFPMRQVEVRWSGQVMEPVDGLAYIGRNPGEKGHVFIATGDSGQGMTHGAIAGMLLSDLILGRRNPWEHLYDPSRKTLRSVGDFVRENVNAVSHFVEYVTPGEVPSEAEIGPGHGAIVRSGLHKLAVYRDDAGSVHRLSAICPHLGCMVHWNSLERTWDCPCHGSRFSPDGAVLNGPAVSGLSEAGHLGDPSPAR